MSRRRRSTPSGPRRPPAGRPGFAPEALLAEGLAHHQAGRLGPAEGIYRRILAFAPDHPEALHLLGVLGLQIGRFADATRLIERSLSVRPGNAEALNNLGQAYDRLGRTDDAAGCYRQAIALRPGFAAAHSNLGNALMEKGDLKGAVACYERALKAEPRDPEILSNLGGVLLAAGKTDAAMRHIRRARTIAPGNPVVLFNLGNAHRAGGRLEEAAACYRKALNADPDDPEILVNLGSTLMAVGDKSDAVVHFERAVAVHPGFADAHYNLGLAYWNSSRADDAKRSFARALALKPEKDAWRLLTALVVPAIPASVEDIVSCRDSLKAAVRAFRDRGIRIADPLAEVGVTAFDLAYHGLPDREIQETTAAMYVEACPGLAWTAPHCKRKAAKRDRLKIGFVSSLLRRGHTIGKLNRGTLENLSRQRFEVVLFRPRPHEKERDQALDGAADRAIDLPPTLEAARQAVAAEELDVVFYPDIGMSPDTYFLAFARLAPVQVATWGHPDTTGIPNLDYFLSPSAAEPADADGHYSERLVRFRGLITCYRRPRPPADPPDRRALGLPADKRLYLCPQTLFKFHPAFDPVLGDILEGDPAGVLVLIGPPEGRQQQTLIEARFRRAFPAAADRVMFLQPMALEKYLGLLMLADAMLDLPTFSGGNSSLEAFALGVPVVTWPGAFMRGRVTLACYRQMGIDELVAGSADEYVALAHKLARDMDFRAAVRAKIHERSDRLFENTGFVRELEDFLEAACEARRQGKPLVRWPTT